MTHSHRHRWLIALLPILLSSGCRLPAPSLRMGINDWPGYEYFTLAQVRGIPRSQGLDLQLKRYSSQSAQVTAYVGGQLDAIAITVQDLLPICARAPHRCPAVVQVIDESQGADRIIAAPRIRSLRDLRGEAIAREDTALGIYMLQRAFEQQGVPLESRLRFARQVEMPALLSQGQVAAVVTYAPVSLDLTEMGFRTLFSSRQLPGEIVDVLAVDPGWLEQHPQQVRALVHSFQAARALTLREPEASLRTLAQAQKTSVEAFRRAQTEIRYPPPGEQRQLLDPRRGAIARTLIYLRRLLSDQGQIPENTPMPRLEGDWGERQYP